MAFIQYDPLKRFFDILLSSVLLLFFFPLFCILALIVKVTSPGPVFYGSIRLGQGGKVITCWKFRSMYCDAENRLHELLSSDPALREEWNRFQKLKSDPRITSFGHFLRRTSLDEWPQFWNVLKGDLSIVGPRPLTLIGPPEHFFEEMQSWYGSRTRAILSVKPGLTGVWQTSGRSEVSIEERAQLEERYAQTRTLFKDFILLIKTVPALLFSRGAF